MIFGNFYPTSPTNWRLELQTIRLPKIQQIKFRPDKFGYLHFQFRKHSWKLFLYSSLYNFILRYQKVHLFHDFTLTISSSTLNSNNCFEKWHNWRKNCFVSISQNCIKNHIFTQQYYAENPFSIKWCIYSYNNGEQRRVSKSFGNNFHHLELSFFLMQY